MGSGKKMVKCAVVLVMLIVSAASVPIAENDSTFTTESPESREDRMIRYRLPNNTIPRLYNIHIEPNMDDWIFKWTGKISVDIEVMDPTPQLTLHAYKNLVFDETFTELVDANGTKLTPVIHNRDGEVEFLMLQFDHDIPVGNYSLSLKYAATATEYFNGFYKASDSTTSNVAGTHFEATTARRAFPCWDEPGLKARFRMSITHLPNYTAISNMPEIEHVQTPDGKILTTFETTPIMSTYLLTFVISDYENVFNEHRNVSVHTSKQALEEVRHVMELSPKVIEVMESYTGFPFGLPRVGSVTLPMYSSSATEHWGLVSYAERAISVNSTMDTTSRKDVADMLIAHELSHSWFGNRVTPLWWDDLWLNEAFATYFSYYIMDEIYDNWGGAELFVLWNSQDAAFRVDHDFMIPVRWTPIDNIEIRKLFSPITYRKGPAIVHMFRNVLGDNVFRVGIQKYMAKHSFKAVVAEDLMIALQEAYDEGPNKEKPLNLKATMTPWLVQTGYPMINVTRNYTTGDTKVCQENNVDINSSSKWWIPLTYATKSNPNFSSTLPTSWISDKEDCVKIDGIDKDDWIILNIRASGYYRVNYDDENWDRIASYLNTDNYKNIHVLNRAQLIYDAFYLSQFKSNRYYRIFYKLTKYLSREIEYLPWRSAHNALTQIEDRLHNTEVHTLFVRYVLELMDNFIEKVGFEVRDTDDHFTKLSRMDVINWACTFGHSGCMEYAAQKLIKLVENPVENQLHPDTSRWTFCAGLRGLNDTAAKHFATWASEYERDMFFASVDCTVNHEIHRNIMNASMLERGVGHTYYAHIPKLLMSTEENFNFAVDYFLEHLHEARNNSDIMADWIYRASDVVSYISRTVKTRSRLEKFKEVLLLLEDVAYADLGISTTLIREEAEKNVAKCDAVAAVFMNVWDKQLSAGNSITGARTESR